MRLNDIGAKNDMPRGWYSQSIINTRIYTMWKELLRRVFDKWKGYEDCIVHPDFLLLSNFVEWIESEPNYPLLVEDPSPYKWCIDKDGIVEGNKEYVPGKMQLVTRSFNCKERNKRCGHPNPHKNNPYFGTKAILGLNISTYEISFYSRIKDAYGYDASNITRCCKGKQKTHRNCIWFYATDLLGLMNYLYKESI